MENMKYSKLFVIAMFSLFFIIPFSLVSTGRAQSRNATAWSCGYDTLDDNLNPFYKDPAYGAAFMYEPLFGYNDKTQSKIPVIGLGYTWASDGSGVTVTINPNAKWSDGTSITPADVVYSYELAMEHSQNQPDMTDRLASVAASGSDKVVFTLNSEYYYSLRLDELLTLQIPIVPEAVWEAVATDVGGIDKIETDFINDWFDPTFNEDWKVCSGPYEPNARSADKKEVSYKLRRDASGALAWWGAGKIHKDLPGTAGVPQVEYIGNRDYEGNEGNDAAFATGEVDLHGGFLPGLRSLMAENPNVMGWNGRDEPYYLNLKGNIMIGMNQIKEPFNQQWFREALAWSIDHDEIIAAANPEWKRMTETYLVPWSPTHQGYFSQDVQDEYAKTYDEDKAIEILEAHCTGSVSEGWTYNGKKLGPYTIMTPTGWGDVGTATEMWAEDFTAIGIETSKVEKDFDTDFKADVISGDFDMVMQCCGPDLVNTPSIVFQDFAVRRDRFDRNVSAWQGLKAEEYKDLMDEFETLAPAARKVAAEDMQEILAQEIPAIFCYANIFFYAYREDRFQGWLNGDNYYQQPVTSSTVNMMAAKQRLFLALTPNPNPPAEIPWTGLFIVIGLMGVILPIMVARKIKKRE
jgi:peptide/nickel transport system substrate-binding protein